MKWMDKKLVAVIAAAAASALLLAAVPAFGEGGAVPESPSGQHRQAGRDWMEDHGHKHEGHKARRLEHLKEAAEYFGISTEGKTAEQLRAELKAAREKDTAKWERFKAEQKAKRLKHLQEKAAKLGISTEGKTAKQLRGEIRAACREKRSSAVKPERKSGKDSKKGDRTAKKVGQPADVIGSHT